MNLITLDMEEAPVTLPHPYLCPWQQSPRPKKPQTQRSHPSSWCPGDNARQQRHQQQQQGHTRQHLWQGHGGWKCQFLNITRGSSDKRNQNLGYSATYWKSKERPLIATLESLESNTCWLLQIHLQRNNASRTMKNHSNKHCITRRKLIILILQKPNLKSRNNCDLIENSK